jgi:hypothetical protein
MKHAKVKMTKGQLACQIALAVELNIKCQATLGIANISQVTPRSLTSQNMNPHGERLARPPSAPRHAHLCVFSAHQLNSHQQSQLFRQIKINNNRQTTHVGDKSVIS